MTPALSNLSRDPLRSCSGIGAHTGCSGCIPPFTLAETFDRIYRTNAWAGSDAVTSNSGLGSTGRYVDEYGLLISPLLRKRRVNAISGLGCGNFYTGKVIAAAAAAEHYTGVDIAQPVIDANTRVHAGERVQFVRVDLTRDRLPPADGAIVRQALQH